MTQLVCINNTVPSNKGGCISVFTPATAAAGQGLTRLEMLRGPNKARSYLANNRARNGGAISVSNAQVKMEYADFHSNSALLSGGSVHAEDASFLILTDCSFTNSSVGGTLPPGMAYATRQGGVISTVAGHLTIDSCTFKDSTVLPPGGMADCADYFQEESASTSDYRGGVLAMGETSFESLTNTVIGARACSGGYFYFSGRANCNAIFDSYIGLHAYTASGFVVAGVQTLNAFLNEAHHCRSERAAGLFAVSSSQEMFFTESVFNNISVGDGESVIDREHTSAGSPISAERVGAGAWQVVLCR